MRVALVSRYPLNAQQPRGGVEAVTVVLAQALARLEDVEVHVLSFERQSLARVTDDSGDGVSHHRLARSSWPQIADIFLGPGRAALRAVIRELDADVVHCHETHGLGFGGDSGVPHVFTVHGFDHANVLAERRRYAALRSPLWRAAEAYGLSRQKNIISISPYVRAMIEPRTRARIHDIDNPVDERFFGIQRDGSAGRVLCVGWVNERKNTLASVLAFAGAVGRGHSGTLVVAGDAKEPGYLEKVRMTVKERGISTQVEFLGHVDRSRLEVELARATVVLLPSFQENAPMAIAEAMAAGVPVIASNRCGMPFMVEDGRSGFLVEPDDMEQIADRLARLLSSETLSDEMGHRGREIAKARFHPDAVARKTRDVYLQVVGGCSGSR